ncbi:hypothetical protein AGMMS49543_08500 [Betaproteobacteria bacterium]|nr:hypothetical protein AGMMS49543_08500 [Betaproteobacteria bacterium]
MQVQRRVWWQWLIVAVVVALAVFLRFQQIDAQWLTDDEWHAVHKALSGATYGDIALAVAEADFSIPQTLAYKWLAAHGGLDELGMRLPMLVAGLVLVLGGGRWAWRNFGATVGLGFMGLLAISPALVYFSRNARPYGLTVVLSWGALLALARWRNGHGVRWAWTYALAAVLACWLHMAVAPFVLAPLALIAGLDAWQAWRERRRAVMGGSWALGFGVALAVLLLAGLPMLLNTQALALRMGSDVPSLATWIGVWFVWLGTGSRVLVVLCLALALVGAGELYRRRPDVFRLALAGGLAALAAVYLSRPAWVHNPVTFGRYLLPVAPLLLLCVALGTGRVLAYPGHPSRLRTLAPGLMFIALGGALLVNGPSFEIITRPNNFSLHSWYQFDYRVRHNPMRTRFMALPEPPFWRQLAALPPRSVRVAVAGHALESYTLSDVRWQPIHRQQLWSAQLNGYCGGWHWGEAAPESGVRLKNAVSLADPASLRHAAIDYVVFNRWREGEMPDLASCIERFAREHGAAEYEDEYVVAFRLTGK